MTAKDLKNAILQEAVQGKLVPQIVSEGNAKDLLEQIKAEKAKLVKEGKIKKEKPLPAITEDEIPFDIPESWCWCKLNSISNITKLAGFEYSEYITENLVSNGIPLFKGQNVKDSYISYKFDSYIPETLSDQLERSQITKKCLLTPYVGAGVGNVGIHNHEGKFHLGSNVGKIEIILNNQGIEEFLLVFLKSQFGYQEITKHIKATGIPSISIEALRDVNIPLPPLSEQKRIVAAIEKFMPLIEEYGKKETVLNQLNAQIGTLTKKAILQEAVQGKLVPQIASEGNAKDLLEQIKAQKAELIKEGKIKKEKPLPEITEDEIPFDIPENWCWCRLGELGDFTRGSGIKRDETTKEGFPCVRYGEMYTTYKVRFLQTKSFTSKEVFNKCHKIHSNDILMALTGENKWDIALAAVYEGNDELAMGGDLCKFTPIKCDSSFLVYLINSPYGIEYKRNTSTGDIIVHTSTSKLGNLLIPLPPLSEQKRIVEAIEKLLPYCEKLGRK